MGSVGVKWLRMATRNVAGIQEELLVKNLEMVASKWSYKEHVSSQNEKKNNQINSYLVQMEEKQGDMDVGYW